MSISVFMDIEVIKCNLYYYKFYSAFQYDAKTGACERVNIILGTRLFSSSGLFHLHSLNNIEYIENCPYNIAAN